MYFNRYNLHPRRLDDLAREEAESFITFLETPDNLRAAAHGMKLAEEGMGEKTVLTLLGLFHDLCASLVPGDPGRTSAAMRQSVNLYMSALVQGFMEFHHTQTLNDQEQLRRALSTALEEKSREILVKNHAIETSINGIMLADLAGRVTYVNPAFLALWGFGSAEEVVGASMGDFWDDEEARRIVESLPSAGGWRGELAARRKDGALMTVSLASSVIKNESGASIGIMTSFVDVTESRQLEAQIQQIQKMDALGQLARGIAHDFNNILTAISGFLQLLLIEAEPDSQMHHDIMQIKSTVERGAGLTKQLRYFTRQATGKRQKVNLNEIASEANELLKHTFAPDITISLKLSADPWSVEADPNQMSQVLVNLCVNGRDAIMEKGVSLEGKHPTGTISVDTENVELTESQAKKYLNVPPGKYVRLRVSDTGVGMPPELIERLFIPFITTKAAKSGAGLGLAVVYGIVRGHKGFIDVASTPGKGTALSVFLPASVISGQPTAVAQSEPALVRGEGTVLVVDDEAAVREVIVRTLSASGYTATAVENGGAALSLFRDHAKEIDLVVLDMIMPDLGGLETLKRLKEANPSVAVLVITGYSADGLANDLAANGADGFLEKPLDLKLFAEKVKALIEKRVGER
jgi:two-component system cell cycle sensor histidine kinase/response regulator CckA